LIEDDGWITWHDVYDRMQEIIDPKSTNVLSYEVQKAAERLNLKYKDMMTPAHSQTTIRAYSDKNGRLPPGKVLSLEDYAYICELSETIKKSFMSHFSG
jgi:hypothetical protein